MLLSAFRFTGFLCGLDDLLHGLEALSTRLHARFLGLATLRFTLGLTFLLGLLDLALACFLIGTTGLLAGSEWCTCLLSARFQSLAAFLKLFATLALGQINRVFIDLGHIGHEALHGLFFFTLSFLAVLQSRTG